VNMRFLILGPVFDVKIIYIFDDTNLYKIMVNHIESSQQISINFAQVLRSKHKIFLILSPSFDVGSTYYTI